MTADMPIKKEVLDELRAARRARRSKRHRRTADRDSAIHGSELYAGREAPPRPCQAEGRDDRGHRMSRSRLRLLAWTVLACGLASPVAGAAAVDSRQAAAEAIGCMQVNWRWHRHAAEDSLRVGSMSVPRPRFCGRCP